MSAPLDARAAATLITDYLGPAAELVSAAVDAPPPGPVAVVGHFSAVAHAVFEAQHPGVRVVAVESMPPPLLRQVAQRAESTYGASYPLPLRNQGFAAVLEGLSFADHTTDTTVMREAARVVWPGGEYAGVFLMRGSFQIFFDVARAVCELGGLGEALNAVREAEAQFRHPDTLKGMASRAGLMDVECGLEERVLTFANAEAFLTDAGVRNVLLRRLALAGVDLRHQLIGKAQEALESETGRGAVNVRVVTGVLRGIRPAGG